MQDTLHAQPRARGPLLVGMGLLVLATATTALGGAVAPSPAPPAAGWTLAWQVQQGSPVTSVAVSRDGGVVASGSVDGSVKIWEAAKGRPSGAGTLRASATPVDGIVFMADGRFAVATAAGSVPPASANTMAGPGRLVAWSADGRSSEPIDFAHDGFHALGWSSSLLALVSGSKSGDAGIIGTPRFRLLRTLHGSTPSRLAVSPHGDLVAVQTTPTTVTIFDMSTSVGHARVAAPAGVAAWTPLAFSPDGTQLLLAAAPAPGLWLAAWKAGALEAVQAEGGPVLGLDGVWSPRGDLLAVATSERVLLLDGSTHAPRATLEVTDGRVATLAFSANGAVLVAGDSMGRVLCWSRPAVAQR